METVPLVTLKPQEKESGTGYGGIDENNEEEPSSGNSPKVRRPPKAWQRRLKAFLLPAWRWLAGQCAPLKCWKSKDDQSAGQWREITIMGGGKHFVSNKISTTKYNLLTFFPRFLFDQFRRYANLFFLIIVLLQQIPNVSPTGQYTTAVPLSIVLLVAAIKELIEDLRRFKGDNEVNSRRVTVLQRSGEELSNVKWSKVRAGDIVIVENRDFFPADLILLKSSDPDGRCYIQTASLDGETNLKIRLAHSFTADYKGRLSDLLGHVDCEPPNRRLYEFQGNLSIRTNGSFHKIPVHPDNILLRGATLKNTDRIYGLVVYTGHDSKMLQNSRKVPLKRSNIDSVTNKQILFLFLILLILALVSSIGSSVWRGLQGDDHWYLRLSTNAGAQVGNFFLSILTFIILYNNLIPISLIVTLEFVKFIQGIFMSKDLQMYHSETDTPAVARNSNLNEELGQVQYIFSDKTGTLTQNVMEFKECSVNGKKYSLNPQETDALRLQAAKKDPVIVQFLRILALCHTVVPDTEDGKLCYRAASPDEGALVDAARKLGVVFEKRSSNSVTIRVHGALEEYELLNVLEFSSARKRMSVIIRDVTGQIKLLCKGADNIVFDRLRAVDPLREVTTGHLNGYAINGLRTLCVAETVLNKVEYEDWKRRYDEASLSEVDREKKLEQVEELIEKNLVLLGATAVEDKLQEGVPETISQLRKADIKLWVLTGDKMETAINIGYSSKLLTSDNMEVHRIAEDSREAVLARVQELHNLVHSASHAAGQNLKLGIALNGKALGYILQPDTGVSAEFLELALQCHSVICCRVTPSQKAEIVELVRRRVQGAITLAVGDGANDVSMILAAHVGVGIVGKEGMQATLASDYAIGQFRFLERLLLVHGAWNYNRLAKMILYSFYKNICLYIIEFWFVFYNGYSGQTIFERWTIGLYNVLFTGLPPLALGLFEQDVRADVRLANPSLYHYSQKNKGFNVKVFWMWVMLSIIHSLELYFFTYGILHDNAPLYYGKSAGLFYVGNVMYSATVITVCLQAAVMSSYWTWITHFTIWGSIATWFIFIWPYSFFSPTLPIGQDFMGQAVELYGSPMFYFAVLVLAAVTMLPVLVVKVFKTDLRLDLEKYILLPRDVQDKIHDVTPRGWCPCLFKNSRYEQF